MRKTYYELAMRVRPGFAEARSVKVAKNVITGTLGNRVSPAGWKQPPPHVELANLGYENHNHAATAAAARGFIRQYGPPVANENEILLPSGWDQFEISMGEFNEKQGKLRHAWKERDAKALWFGWGFENCDLFNLPATWTAKGLELCPADCWTYLRLLLTRDLAEDRARICKNKNCKAPYFVAPRGNKIFCGRRCANAVTQRNFQKKRRKR